MKIQESLFQQGRRRENRCGITVGRYHVEARQTVVMEVRLSSEFPRWVQHWDKVMTEALAVQVPAAHHNQPEAGYLIKLIPSWTPLLAPPYLSWSVSLGLSFSPLLQRIPFWPIILWLHTLVWVFSPIPVALTTTSIRCLPNPYRQPISAGTG